MTPKQKEAARTRWFQIDQQLKDLADGRVIAGDGDPATLEDDLLQELDELDYYLGLDYFEERDARSF